MEDDLPAVQLIEIATSSAPLTERARGLLEKLAEFVPSDATWLALANPRSNVHTTVGSTGLDRPVLDYLERPAVAREIQLAGIKRASPPPSLVQLPIPADELPTWSECLIPAGFHQGLGVPLSEPGGPYLGMLTLLFSRQPPSPAMRDRLSQLSPMIARGVSPMRSLLATARLVRGATAGALLYEDGTTYPLDGLQDHSLLAAASPVVAIARKTLLAGHVYQSFMWPTRRVPASTTHMRITVLAATEAPDFVLGALLLTPDADCRGLTPRELQVLGLLVDGRSNQQIATRLAVATRTVAAHVEHLLDKLGAPSRTLAAVLAEREGCYVPPLPGAPMRHDSCWVCPS
ncbi:LuxR C-terminal-related transcriptional regulator [Nocardioides panacis]|uniref:LuxR C-terminal-related transcriptional regulator n=1 Tax=Nocardioides panacis TaxID=2849501 RepID=A0A975SZA1_9ACTN|nr:LuxR C-terminal-related transcriptional regulator [Nocardioides panacis]QWZ08636.1 LuxR C-terminal-related transcriptional regulator [Nocardioides panacis]